MSRTSIATTGSSRASAWSIIGWGASPRRAMMSSQAATSMAERRAIRKTQFAAYLAGAAYNLLRVSRLRSCAS